MPITFTQAERKEISREVVNLPGEAASANQTNGDVQALRVKLLQKDANIKKFYDNFDSQAQAYQSERTYIDATVYTNVLESQIQDSAKRAAGNLYFPLDGQWINFTPKAPSPNNLIGLPLSSVSDYELRVLNNVIENQSIEPLFQLMKNGQAGAATDTLVGSYAPAQASINTLVGGQAVGSLIFLGAGANVALLKVTSYTPPDLLALPLPLPAILGVTAIIDSAGTIGAGSVYNNLPAHSNTQRNTFTSAIPTDYINLLASKIIARTNVWKGFLQNQQTQLNANGDTRSPQAAEITAAKLSVTNALNAINTWISLPLTGTTGLDSKFVDTQWALIQAQRTSRNASLPTRVTQITTALGSISQAGDGSVTGSGIYKLRYDQINNRINLTGGPLSQYWQQNVAVNALQSIADTKNSQLSTFTASMKATPLALSSKGTQKLEVVSTADFSPGQTIYVVSETQAELTGTIYSIDTATQITLNFVVPDTYKTGDKARILRTIP